MIIINENGFPIKVIEKEPTKELQEKAWIEWNAQSNTRKRKSDEYAIEEFGKTNEDLYDSYMNQPILELDQVDLETPPDIQFGSEDIDRAKQYMLDSNYNMIYPAETIDELEQLWDKYQSMNIEKRKRADIKCAEIFGYDNTSLYNMWKGKLLSNSKKALPDNNCVCSDCQDDCDCTYGVDELESLSPKDEASKITISRLQNHIHETVARANMSASKWHPMLTSDEIIRLSENITTEGSRLYDDIVLESKGFVSRKPSMTVSEWSQLVRETMYKFEHATDDNERASLREQVINLGWNPYIDFTSDNRARASIRFESAPSHKINNYDIIDIVDSQEEPVNDIEPLYPVYIVLVEGITAFSSTIMKVTKGPFSHAAIALDATLNKMYTFNIGGGQGKLGGLSYENVKEYPPDSRLGVFTILVREKDIHTIQNLFERYDKNKEKTSYSFFNVLTLPFNRGVKMDFTMICSEFVDNILKLCNIEIIEKDSPLVSPNDFYRASQKNTKIYRVYDGKVSRYNPERARKRVAGISRKGKYIKESSILEAAEFPIQFSKEGDLLIKNIGKLNYEDEYKKSHRLLRSYDKANNIEGMKYELSKLWFLNMLLERDIYSQKNEVANSKCRSRVLNDFNTYLEKVQRSDSDFNFDAYYKDTPFNTAVIKINNSTLKYTTKIIKDLIFM